MADKKNTEAPKTDAMTKERADKIRVLVREDIRKYELEIARHDAAIGQLRVYVAECHATLADVDRREAGVEYPKPPAENPAGTQMGEPVGGAENAQGPAGTQMGEPVGGAENAQGPAGTQMGEPVGGAENAQGPAK